MPQPPQPQMDALSAAAGSGLHPELLQTEADLIHLLRVHGPRVRNSLLSRFSPQLTAEDAEEILSVALQKAWDHRHSFFPAKSSLRAWFFCIAQRVALDRFKCGWQKSRQKEVSWDETHQEPSTQPVYQAAEPENDTDHQEQNPPETNQLRLALADAMASLSEVQRRIIWADALGAAGSGVTSDDLGTELGIPAGTVRVYRKRGMEKLRIYLMAHLTPTKAQTLAP